MSLITSEVSATIISLKDNKEEYATKIALFGMIYVIVLLTI
jgi:hypothetical protein